MKDLVFFDKEGNYLNFQYDTELELYTGELIFHENSDDTFKTIGLYLFEKIEGFEFSDSLIKLQKFQLFNEFGFNITNGSYQNEQITKIEATNNDPKLKSKWIHGENFDKKYPLGSEIKFNSPIFEFTEITKTYTVVSSKRNAVLIISSMNNNAFNTAYESLTNLTSSYENKTISSVNSLGIHNYTGTNSSTLSEWSEPYFWSNLYSGRKLNLLGTEKNDSVVTVKGYTSSDKQYWQYSLTASSFSQSSNLWMEVIIKTDLPAVYSGAITVQTDKIVFGSQVPSILKPGTEFKIISNINTDSYIIASIPDFRRDNTLRYYNSDDQVLWNNTVYQCINAYTQSATSSITPINTTYWTSDITYLSVATPMASESLVSTQLFLNKNIFYFETKAASLTASNQNEITLASCAEQWADELKNFNIDLKFENEKLIADLNYASEYATVNFYKDFKGSASNLIGATAIKYEKIIEVEETLNHEFNNNISENHYWSVVFTDIDEYGIIISINGLDYQQEVQWSYDGLNVDLRTTVDKTLRAWLENHYYTLLRLGIVSELDYTLSSTPAVYSDTLNFYTIFPNISFVFDVKVGTTANYYIKHSMIEFLEIGSILNLTINDRQYLTQFGSQSIAISDKLQLWINEHQETLDDFGIFTNNYNNAVLFNIKEQTRNIRYSVSIGRTPLPGENSFNVTNFIKGNIGSLITSNSIILATASSSGAQFYDVNGASAGEVSFATGMITTVNNSVYPFNNQQYNLIEVNKDRLVLSYQGPFWGSTYSIINNPKISIYYDTGYTQSTSNDTEGISGLIPWQEVSLSENKGFDSYRKYTTSTISIPIDTQAITDITDIVYVPFLRRYFILGSNIKVYEADTNLYLETIVLSTMTTPVRIIHNTVDNLIYALSLNKVYRINPTTLVIEDEISLGYTALNKTDLDITFNSNNGDIYISSVSGASLKIIARDAVSASVMHPFASYRMVYDTKKDHLWVITGSNVLRQFNGKTSQEIDLFNITGITSRNTIALLAEDSSVWVMGDYLTYVKNSDIFTLSGISADSNNYLIYDNISNSIILSRNGNLSSHYGTTINWNISYSNYGNLAISNYDDKLYIGAQNTTAAFVIDTATGQEYKSITGLGSNISKIIYNAARNSILAILSNTSIIEISVETYIFYRYGPQDAYANVYNPQGERLGNLSENYIEPENIWLTTRDYIRKPRMNFIGDNQAKLIYKWERDDVPELFLYDFSGEQLEKTGSYKYIGEKPLKKVYLNRKPNRDLTKVSEPEYQQTIFPQITYEVDYINSNYDLSFMPEPLECFIGYKADEEGTHRSILKLKLNEQISFTLTPSAANNNVITLTNIVDNLGVYGRIDLATSSTDNFLTDSSGNNRGLRKGQDIMLLISDVTNKKNQYTSFNNGIRLKIQEITLRSILVDFLDDVFFEVEENVVDHNGLVTLLSMTFTVLEKDVARIIINGQTEIEDIRYKTNLGNLGKLVSAEDVFIFKTYDINEQGIDWKFLNNKRKEMIIMKDEIYPYIGSYKAIINAINYFGYNDLEFYEYYRNVDFNSPDFNKLVKIEIPDIFDNRVPGWKENDWIRWTLPNPKFADTNLFNLTYRITDREGNNVLMYSLAEVITKLSGLKKWLESNVIPITHRIYDITGRADFVQTNTIIHKNYAIKSYTIKQSMSPVDFDLNEAYLMPVNSGSSVYNCVLDFRILDKDYVPDYFSVKVRTYKTYAEWQPFKTYSRGQIVSYFNENWESVQDNNRLNNPRKYLETSAWVGNIDYVFGQIVEYKRHYYVYGATQSSFSLTASNPYTDQINGTGLWTDITEWKRLDYVPVQSLKEYRTGTHSFNFTVDSNIDPYIVVEVTSENGYGLTWTTKKSYQITGIENAAIELENVDRPGPIKIWERIKKKEEVVIEQPVEYITLWEAITPECL